jgi:general secretion pathway protein I
MPGWHCDRSADSRAFTLIEVLIALAIVAVALMAAMRAAGQGTQSVEEMRSRLLASWVAQNRLAEHRARDDWLPLGVQRGTARLGGMAFAWREEVLATANSNFRRVDVVISPAAEETHTLARLTGFVLQAPRSLK